MRVSTPGTNRSRNSVSAAARQAGRAPATAFSSLLLDEQVAVHQERLEQLFAQIESACGGLSLSSSLSSWESFRALVVAYLEEAKLLYKLRKQAAWDYRGNHKVLVLIDTIDQELLAMGMDFLNRERDNLEFLDRLKRLKGMLIDLRS